jgi:endonuclease/exonuclease/phosphatase family metal-dependent hydrolase
MGTMKIVDLNMYYARGWRLKKDVLVSNLRDINPEIFCAQEITGREIEKGQYIYEGIELEKELQYGGFYSSGLIHTSNQGIFIKPQIFKVIDEQKVSFSGILQTGEIDKHRRFLLAQLLRVDGKDLLIVNLHLSTTKVFRYQNWKEFLIWLESIGYEDKRILVVGDFNTYEKEDVHDEILKSGFSNAWDTVRRDKCITYRSSDWWVKNLPDDRISERIAEKGQHWDEGCLDYVFYRGDIKINSAEYLDLVPEYTDHKGLVVDFDVI